MKLNCKPGDLAVIVRDDYYPENIGKFCTVLHRSKWENHPDSIPGPIWNCRPHSPITGDVMFSNGEWQDAVTDMDDFDHPDAWLKPIRDPGEDATDETLTWLPVPGEKVEA